MSHRQKQIPIVSQRELQWRNYWYVLSTCTSLTDYKIPTQDSTNTTIGFAAQEEAICCIPTRK
jgi:hypothetical protein